MVPPPVLDPRITEHRNPRSADIDLASPLQIVELINAEDRTVADAVASQKERIAEAVAIAEDCFRRGGRLVYAGAGTSGRLGVLDASECPPTFGVSFEMVRGLIAGGYDALLRAQEGAEDSPEGGARDVDQLAIGPDDFLIGVAASGGTPYVRGAMARARERGARVGMVACTPPPAEVVALAHVAIVPITGPEVVTGSTRMKAGTATKLVLNTISTGAMIRIGKTYGNLMVDLRATNEKLRDRSERILVEVCSVDRPRAKELLAASGGSVKTAIVMNALGIDRDGAEAALEKGGGVVRRVIPGPPPPVR
ncbi:MAG: N-acetylmuramic acid 6-phosphate etherase [Gemmatimonadaceae bacterium]|nr:N-acetylmuramic acid 6-phosphate etherase [Gemmatimonadaceae bacterium]NUQ94158.1 N-acetylmuramic acid 6-phosphate etherase [Gemmatimonadaceae bacterium]NUR19890.1 N-acetylmuramic acid 6-phosphate etherase [Gemmatimonadaceae bacterium]